MNTTVKFVAVAVSIVLAVIIVIAAVNTTIKWREHQRHMQSTSCEVEHGYNY